MGITDRTRDDRLRRGAKRFGNRAYNASNSPVQAWRKKRIQVSELASDLL